MLCLPLVITLGELEGFIESQHCDSTLVAGDFNVDFDRGGPLASLLEDFASDQNFVASCSVHTSLLDNYASHFVSTLLDSASSCFPCHSASKPRVPGWNESAGKLKELSIFWNRVWTEAGCPSAGVLSTIKRHAKKRFHVLWCLCLLLLLLLIFFYCTFTGVYNNNNNNIDQLRAIQPQRLAAETPGEREGRLDQLRTSQQQRLAAETPEEREGRLDQLRTSQQQRLAAETPRERRSTRSTSDQSTAASSSGDAQREKVD